MLPARRKKIETVMALRRQDLSVVLDNVFDPHNVAAILRSCDAFGVGEVHLLYTTHPMPHLRDLRGKAAASAAKWLTIVKWQDAKKLVRYLKKKKQRIAVTDLSKEAVDPREARLSDPVALVIGNEHEGVSKEMTAAADVNLKIPMIGFVQSFNVSVAAALLLYEAYRQSETHSNSPLARGRHAVTGHSPSSASTGR